MKRLLLYGWLCLLLLTDCKKETGCKAVNPADESAPIVEYTIKNGIEAIKDGNGIYYALLDSGYGISPTARSKVTVTYTGRYLNGTVFDSSVSPKSFALSEVIEGWQLGLPHVQKGGRILLFIPSAYAYGCAGNKSLNIPPDTVLLFDLTLIDVE